MEEKTESGLVRSNVARQLERMYGIHLIRINAPVPDLKTNIYFAEKPVPTLIDAPPDAALCLDELNAALLALGYSVEKIRRIIISHPHWDHFGGARTIVEMSGTEVWVYEGASQRFENYGERIRKTKDNQTVLLKRAGATTSEMESVVAFFFEAGRSFARNILPSKRLKEGDKFEFGALTLTVAATPGHTPWCILLFDENQKIAFSGDLFVNGNPSDPLIFITEERPTECRSLASYRTSLEAVNQMNLKILLPGHGPIIQDASKRIDGRLKVINKRRLAILRALKGGSQTAGQIALRLFPDLPQIQFFHAILEVLNHLELLEKDLLVERGDGTPTYFSLATG